MPEEWRRIKEMAEKLGVDLYVNDHGVQRLSLLPLLENLAKRIATLETQVRDELLADTPGIMNPIPDMFPDG